VLAWIDEWLSTRYTGTPSVLGPIFVNDLDSSAAAVDQLKKFAHDTKLGHDVTKELQRSLDGLVEWEDRYRTWGMQCNVLKCKAMHLGWEEPQQDCVHDGRGGTSRNGGRKGHQSVRHTEAETAWRRQKVLGQITRAFHYRDRHVFVLCMNVQAVCEAPFEFCIQAWSPWHKEGKTCLEKVSVLLYLRTYQFRKLVSCNNYFQ